MSKPILFKGLDIRPVNVTPHHEIESFISGPNENPLRLGGKGDLELLPMEAIGVSHVWKPLMDPPIKAANGTGKTV